MMKTVASIRKWMDKIIMGAWYYVKFEDNLNFCF